MDLLCLVLFEDCDGDGDGVDDGDGDGDEDRASNSLCIFAACHRETK